ncbi:hypothetical protein GMORB2_7029 [Geosmithia morbida]|uniref:Uncharacterized protein n=1 Tax=Geosmithia morbida TaxID=1094350 RepID=A0A9P4YVT0_9HYPO|nr:uncharacterized protein GMORB2_7029 [Geosmithia morbida]KAF4122722.1 hypothetical protein GMORB2_7029 [Geosmithia morbida]
MRTPESHQIARPAQAYRLLALLLACQVACSRSSRSTTFLLGNGACCYINGWRYIVLPMAHTDELVMTAVLTVAAFHREAMSRRDGIEYGIMCNADDGESRDHQVPSWTDPIPTSPQALYNRALEGLRQRSNLLGIAHEDPEATIAAVLVLLVTTMVTGRDDYATILGMLYSATEALGGEEKLSQTELGKFLIRQVRK